MELKKLDNDHFWYGETLIDIPQLYKEERSLKYSYFGASHVVGQALMSLHSTARDLNSGKHTDSIFTYSRTVERNIKILKDHGFHI